MAPQEQIAGPIVKEIRARLRFLVDVGLDYLTLERATATLSGGEAQRIRLATQIGAGLMGVLYILDEPSIGLHQRDNERLIATLERLRDLGNTVIVVEHDEDTIRHADYVIDMGPGAGENGGEVVAGGTPEADRALPALAHGGLPLRPPSHRGPGAAPQSRARAHRAQGRVREQPEGRRRLQSSCGTLTVVTGVSGSGKSSLVTDTLAPALANRVNHAPAAHGRVPPARRPVRHRQGHQHRPEPHRAHAPFEPRHLHWPVGRRARAVRVHAGVEGARLQPGALQLQRRRRPLRGMQGRRPDQDRDALPAGHLRALRGVRRRSATTARPSRSPIAARTCSTCST